MQDVANYQSIGLGSISAESGNWWVLAAFATNIVINIAKERFMATLPPLENTLVQFEMLAILALFNAESVSPHAISQ